MELVVNGGSVWYIQHNTGPCLEYGYFTTKEKAEQFASDLCEVRSRSHNGTRNYDYWANKLERSIHNDSDTTN